MALDFRNVVDWIVPDGACVKVRDAFNRIIWQKDTYTIMDYVTCETSYTGIIVPVQIPTGSTYEIMCDARVTEKSGNSRSATLIMGGINSTNSQSYGWGQYFQQYYYVGSNYQQSYGPYDSEQTYWNGWTSDFTSGRFSTGWALNTEIKSILKNTSRVLQNITTEAAATTKNDSTSNWNSAAAVDGWWGFGIRATGETTWASADRFIGNIYGCYIKVDGNYIYNFQPARRDRDGVYGLYDTVNNVFYPSSTTNPFTHTVVPVTSLTLTNTTVGLGKKVSIRRTINPSTATNKQLMWTTSDSAIASVNSSGVVTGNALGTCTITASTTDGSDLTDSCTVRVYTPVTEVDVVPDTLTIDIGESGTASATVYPSNAYYNSVYWRLVSASLSNPVTFTDGDNNTIIVTGQAVGSASFTANCDGVSGYLSVNVVQGVTHVTGVTLNQNSITLEKGNTSTLVATVTPSDAEDTSVSWTSSDTNVATVDSTGKVTAINPGTCTITCTTTDRGYTDTCTVTVPTHRLTINPDVSGTTITFTDYPNVSTSYIDVPKGTVVRFEVSKTNYNTFEGSYTMGTSDYTYNVHMVEGTVGVTSVGLNVGTIQIESGTYYQLVAGVNPSNATDKSLTWSSSNTSVAVVSQSGLVSGVGSGTCTITCRSNDNSNAYATCNVTVYSFSIGDSWITINTFNGSASTFGTLSPNTASITGKWVSSDASVATVTGNTNHSLSGREYITITAAGSTGTTAIYFESNSLTQMLNMPICSVTVDVPVGPVTTSKTVTLFNDTNDTVYYGKNSSTTVGLAAGSDTSVTVQKGETLYFSMRHCLTGQCPVEVTVDSTESVLSVHDDTYTSSYAQLVDGDTFTFEDQSEPLI